MFKVINISPRSAPHHHLRAQEASTVLKRPLLRAPLRRSAQSPPCSWDHTLGHVAHCSAAASLLGPHAVAICPPPPSSSIWHLACWHQPGPEGPSDGRGLFRELCRGWGCPGLASPHRCPHSHSLGESSYVREAARAQTQAEVCLWCPSSENPGACHSIPRYPSQTQTQTCFNSFLP